MCGAPCISAVEEQVALAQSEWLRTHSTVFGPARGVWRYSPSAVVRYLVLRGPKTL
jgi:hypothetical protein